MNCKGKYEILDYLTVTSISELHSSIFPDKEAANRVLIPLVVLKNSGRAADVISFVIETDLNNDKWIHR